MTDDAGLRRGPESGRRKLPGQHFLARSGFIEYDRIVFFSDAVFAIAITLLAVNLRVPDSGAIGSAHELRLAIPNIRGFWISFAVIALFWIGHHGVFRYIVAFDRTLITLNLLFLGLIAFLPYPTDLLSASASRRAPIIFYAACAALAGLAETAIWLYATRSSSSLAAATASQVRTFYLLRIVRVPATFLISIPVAVRWPHEAPYTWLLILVSGAVLNRFWSPGAPPAEESDPAG